ncbi:MAG TPA: DUF2721 domain-containing protein [Polyangia bacterium]|nr:DUF2721 domain-containing protein [Polyangia bacterium]
MVDTSAIVSALAPGVALTSATIYWANLQGRLDSLSSRVRGLNAELRRETKGSPRALSIERQVAMLSARSRVLHTGVVLSVVSLLGFLGSSAMLFIAARTPLVPTIVAVSLFLLALVAMGGSMTTTLWEMLWARRSLDEDIFSSRPRDPAAPAAALASTSSAPP